MSSYDWVALPPRDEAGLEGIDEPMANWWQLRRQGIDVGIGVPELTDFGPLLEFFMLPPSKGSPEIDRPDVGRHFGGTLQDENGDLKIPALPPHALCSDAENRPRPAEALEMEVPENGIILGVIDDAFPCLHPAFRADGTSRVLSLWQQDAPCRAGQGVSPVPFGHMATHSEIQALIDAGRGDDPAAYESLHLGGGAAHLPNLHRFRRTHGAAVAGLMAGADPMACDDLISRQPGRFPIVGVNLGLAMVEDTAGSFLPLAVLFAVQHIVNEAEALMKASSHKVPLVINVSYGLSGGGRNGSHPVAHFLDVYRAYWEATHNTPFRAVLPVGNGFQDRGLLSAELHPGGPALRTRLRAGPGSRASTVVEIERLTDSSAGEPFALEVQVTPPSAVEIKTPRTPGQRRTTGETWVLQPASGEDDPEFGLNAPKHAAVFYHRRPNEPAPIPRHVPHVTVREVVVLAIQPDQSVNGDEPTMPPGDWTIDVALKGDAEGPPEEVELRVLRNDIPSPALPRRQTARFVDPAILRFDSFGIPTQALRDPDTPVRRDRTINAMATGTSSIIVGAAQGGSGPPMSPYSAAGPLESGTRGVTVCALGDESLLRVGMPSIGMRAGSTARVSGSSIAAPQIARWIATAMAQALDDGTDPAAACDANAMFEAAETLCDVPKIRQGLGRITLPGGRYDAP